MECEIKSLASFLAEPASSGAEALFVPIATFVTSLEQVHSDNLLEAAKERRKQESERRRTLAASASSANLRNGSQTDRPMLRRGATMSTMELGSDGRRRPNSARGVADDPAGGVIDDLRRELERRVSSRRSMSTATANGGESPPDSPFLSPAVPYGRNYNDDVAKQRGGAAPAPAPPPHVFEIPKLRPVRRTQATLEREASASSDADQTASGPGPLQMDTTAEAPSLPPPLPPPLLPHVLGGGSRLANTHSASPPRRAAGGSGLARGRYAGWERSVGRAHSVGGLHAAAARQLRWLASAEEEAMERETLSEEQSPQKRSSSMATGSAGSSSNGSSLSGSCNGINGSGSSGGGSPKGGGGGGGGVGGIIRQGVAFVRQHSFERKKEKMKAKAAAAAAAATQAQSAAATAYPSMDMKAWEAKRVSGAANGMPAPTPPTPAAGFDRGAVGAGELNRGARNSHEGTTLPPPPPPPPGRGSSGQRQSLEF